MRRATTALIAAAVSTMPALASAEGTEVMLIGNTTTTDSYFAMLSVRQDLDRQDGGLGLRFDLGRGSYDTNYDGVSGTGEFNDARLILSYQTALGAGTTLTFNGGVVYRESSVSPVTFSSPADTEDFGGFASAEIFMESASGNSLFAVAEYSSVGAAYASSTYLLSLGSLQLGPTANYLEDGDYSRFAYGGTVAVPLNDMAELQATVAQADEDIAGGTSQDHTYVEMQLFFEF